MPFHESQRTKESGLRGLLAQVLPANLILTNKFVCDLHFHEDTLSESSKRVIPGDLPVHLLPLFSADPEINYFLNNGIKEYFPTTHQTTTDFLQLLKYNKLVTSSPD